MKDAKPITEVGELNKIVGLWKATEVTYEMVRERHYMVDSIQLVLHADSTFDVTNIPDACADPVGKPSHNRLLNAKGTWGVWKRVGRTQYGTQSEYLLSLDFYKGDLFKQTQGYAFELYRRGSSMFLFQYVGDPDQVDILEFQKAD